MKHFLRFIKNLFLSLLAFALIFGAGFFIGKNYNSLFAEIVSSNNTGFNLKLPGEVEKRIVTVDEIESRLLEINELSTYSDEYTVTKSVDESRYFLDDIKLLGSTNSITITCTGIIKVGYSLEDISVQLSSEKIFISLPEPSVQDNYVIWDTVVLNEKNNILNPINFSQYQTLVDEIETEGLEDAESKGIYLKAEENLKNIISVYLSQYTEYTIVYM